LHDGIARWNVRKEQDDLELMIRWCLFNLTYDLTRKSWQVFGMIPSGADAGTKSGKARATILEFGLHLGSCKIVALGVRPGENFTGLRPGRNKRALKEQ
jgi:hypothetical protein